MQLAGFDGALVRVDDGDVRVVDVVDLDGVGAVVVLVRVGLVVRSAAADVAAADAEDIDDAESAPPEQAASASATGRARGARRRGGLIAA